MTSSTQRSFDTKEYCHERLAETFADHLSNYDTQRRVEILVDRFLPSEKISGKTVLDVGCGLGYFSQRLQEKGGIVTACDLGPKLVEKTRERVGCRAVVADALRLSEQFGRNAFDFVASSECIEHTPSPKRALEEMIAVVKPGGYLSISTPNYLWYPLVALATLTRFRPFNGFENFSSWGGLRSVFRAGNVEMIEEYGLHLFPFQFHLNPLSRWCDRNLQSLRGVMINLCVLGRKKA